MPTVTAAARLLIAVPVFIAAACSDSVTPVAPELRPAASVSESTISVATAADLMAALVPENAGRRILVQAGTYDIDHPLTVPDGVTLEGEGTMLSDGVGLPSGFGSAPHSTLRMIANVAGDVLTLGNGVTIQRLEIVDRGGRSGNVIGVGSRRPGDQVVATILESEIVNANATFYGLFVQTKNLNQGNDPPPDEGAAVSVRVTRSVIRSSLAGRGVFAFNFAPLGKVAVTLTRNVLGGITANGGVSLPDAVHDSETRIESHGNLYRSEAANPCAAVDVGWNLTGGSGPPANRPVSETSRNTLSVQSVGDRIERFTTAVQATGSRQFFPAWIAGLNSDNTLNLTLIDATLVTPSCGTAQVVRDLELQGVFARPGIAAGNGNTLHAVIRQVTGSGLRPNIYTDAGGIAGPLAPQLRGIGNRLEIVGSAEAFARTNTQIDPAPGAEFFTSNMN